MKKKNLMRKIEEIVKYLRVKVQEDYLASFSAYAALFIIMSLFPLTMFLSTFIKRLPFGMERMAVYVEQYVPGSVKPLMNQIIKEVYYQNTGNLKWITLLVTIFCASKGFYAIRQGLNAVYGIRESRNIVVRYLIASVYVVIFVLMLFLTFIIVVLGEKTVDALLLLLPQFFPFELLIHIGRFLVMFFILVFFFLIMYMNIPNRKSSVKEELPGAAFTTVGWMVYSSAFSFYISHLANYSVTYGSLATMIIFMIWFYSSMYILFLGAECNMALKQCNFFEKVK